MIISDGSGGVASVYFIASVGTLKEVDQLVGVVGGGHPFGRVADIVFCFKPELFEATIGQIFDVLVDVIGIEAEDAFW